jgi:hypothetical protein
LNLTFTKSELDGRQDLNALQTLFTSKLNAELNKIQQAKRPTVTATLIGTGTTKRFKLKVRQDGTATTQDDGTNPPKQILVPARITVMPYTGIAQTSTVVTGDDANGKPTLRHLDKIVASPTDSTFVFGNDWGLTYNLVTIMGSKWKWARHEPDYFTARANKDRELTIDTSKAVGNQRKLVWTSATCPRNCRSRSRTTTRAARN